MPAPNGEPSGLSAGAFAVPRLAARARGAEQIDPCCDRLDRRQIDMVPDPREFLACLFERGATHAAVSVDVACCVRVLCDRSRRARMAFAGFLHPRRLCDVPLLTARRRQRRVVRRLRRLAMLGFKLGDAGQQRLVLREQLVDAHREPAVLPQQLQHQWLHVVSERIDLLRRHASLNQLACKSSTRYTRRRVSNYPFSSSFLAILRTPRTLTESRCP